MKTARLIVETCARCGSAPGLFRCPASPSLPCSSHQAHAPRSCGAFVGIRLDGLPASRGGRRHA